jgi:hypothetical protein
MSNKPLILTDNLFENVVLHPAFALQVSDAAVPPSVFDSTAGHEGFRVADNLRDMTWSTVSTANAQRAWFVDCLAAITPNTIVLDRGHNLAGSVVTFGGANDLALGGFVNLFSSTIPAAPGGLPSDANGCLTPDGVWCKTFTGQSKRVHYVITPALGAGVAPIVTGIYLGTSYRFAEYLTGPGAPDYSTAVKYMRNDMSRGGVRSKSRGINLDKLIITIHLDSVDYPAFDAEIRRMLRYNCPMWFSYDDSDSTGIGQVRLFQLPGDFVYTPNANPVHREITIEFEEVIPTLYV